MVFINSDLLFVPYGERLNKEAVVYSKYLEMGIRSVHSACCTLEVGIEDKREYKERVREKQELRFVFYLKK